MFKQVNTHQLRWVVTASAALLFLGAVTVINAQEQKSARSAEEIQAQIDRLNAELQQVKEDNAKPATAAAPADETLTGNYLGMEGNDWIGIVIGKPQGSFVYPITIYEDGLPDHGFDPRDDDKYVGTATGVPTDKPGTVTLSIALNQKFDEQREEPVEPVLRELVATVELANNQKEFVLTIPRNREWGHVRAVKYFPQPLNTNPATPGHNLAGRYLGYEGNDRFGMVLTPANGEGTFDVVFYEDGLPGAGYNRRDDDRYEGTATFRGNVLDIRLTKKFDEDREEPVEGALKQLSAAVAIEKGNVRLTIQRNPEWDAVSLKKL